MLWNEWPDSVLAYVEATLGGTVVIAQPSETPARVICFASITHD